MYQSCAPFLPLITVIPRASHFLFFFMFHLLFYLWTSVWRTCVTVSRSFSFREYVFISYFGRWELALHTVVTHAHAHLLNVVILQYFIKWIYCLHDFNYCLWAKPHVIFSVVSFIYNFLFFLAFRNCKVLCALGFCLLLTNSTQAYWQHCKIFSVL